MKSLLLIISFLLAGSHANAQLRVYRQLPVFPISSHYTVEIKQTGNFQSIFTYEIPPNATGVPTKGDQIASFGFDPAGGAVQIKVTRKDGVALTAANSKLVNKLYTDVNTSFSGGAMIIQCASVKRHLYVSSTGKEAYPLLLFVDPFADSPIPVGATVVRFAANTQPYVQNTQYDRFTVPNNVDAIVIEDGAMIKGTIHTASGRNKPLIITGRGVILGNGAVLHGAANIPYNALVVTNSSGHLIENIMVINSRHFSVDVSNNSTVDNVKMFGYDANNDGIVAGNFSVIKNLFSKVNDDHVKLYNDNIKVQNSNFWVQTNGGLFQLAWNSTVPGNNCLIENCEVLQWTAPCGDPKLNQGGIARTFLSLHDTDAQPKSSNLTFRNIIVQGQLDRFIGINGKYQGSNSVGFENIKFENITIDKKPSKYSWIYTGASPFKISIDFKNVKVAGECMTASNAPINTEGNVQLTYSGCGTTNKAPSVFLTSPSNNASFEAPATVTLNALASDSDGTIAKVDFYNGTQLLGSDLTSPYSFLWNNVAAGSYAITAKATDNAGASKTSTTTSISVNVPNVAPAVALTTPAAGALYTAPAAVSVTADATDPDGTIAKVEFYNGTFLLGTDLSAPYSFLWNNVDAGSYSISAKAFDEDGTFASSAPVSIIIENPNLLPTVSFNTSASWISIGTAVTLAATATDSDGNILAVDFLNGTTVISSDNAAPYTFVWTPPATGNYTLFARATDNRGAVKKSDPVVLVVDPLITDITALKFKLVNCNKVQLTWSDVGSESGYRIRRKKPTDAGYTILADVPRNQTSYTDLSAGAGQNYLYMVRPMQNNLPVKISNTVSVITPICTVLKTSDAQDESEIAEVNIEPSPFHTSFAIKLNKSMNISKVLLTDVNGNSQNTEFMQSDDQSYQVNADALAPGLYYLQIFSEHGIVTKKIIKQ